MAQLSSPGVSVSVIDESFYTPAAPGTTPLIIVASEQDKQNGSGTGTAPGTLATNAGKVYLMTSQKDLADTFGTPVFKTDANNNPIHAGEQNEYGLQTAYSYLGVSNRAFVVRADVDLGQLEARAEAPAGEPEDGQYWFDTANSAFGIFQWNGSDATVTNGQTFQNKVPMVITDPAKVDAGAPLASIGAIGDYAVVAEDGTYTLWFKKARTYTPAGIWVEVGTAEWKASWPAVQGTVASPVLLSSDALTITVNGSSQTFTGHTSLSTLVADINTANDDSDGAGSGDLDNPNTIPGITAEIINNRLEIYSTGNDITLSGTTLSKVGLVAGTYKAPALQITPHYDVPQYKRVSFPSTYNDGYATGSIWVKTTEPNLGARWRVKIYDEATSSWVEKSAPLFPSNAAALKGLDTAGGGINLTQGALYVKTNVTETTSGGRPDFATFKIYARRTAGATSITSVMNPSLSGGVTSTDYDFTVSETVRGSDQLTSAVTVSFTITSGATDSAQTFVTTFNAAMPVGSNVSASIAATGEIVIRHNDGGDIVFVDGQNTPLADLFTPYTYNQGTQSYTGTANYYSAAAAGTTVASLWSPYADIIAAADAPTTEAPDNQLWYNSLIDQVDILVHNGRTWVGYQFEGNGTTTFSSPYYTATSADKTDPTGPIISATRPKTQTDGTPLVNGDLWVDTSDLENFPRLYKYNRNVGKWVLVDTGDQTTEEGILFRDARWGVDGGTPTAPTNSTIQELLVSDFLDPDAPDPALYPRGMLLWNLRRSGFNVKRFKRDYIDVTGDNPRYRSTSMSNYYPNRWVTESANQTNGAGTFGRKAQRAVVVQALQALVNSNQQIRDEESRVFNLIACPGYPELISEMVSLNVDRGLTAFVVGDTPARLAADATSLNNWGKNVNGATEDGDTGLVSSDEYLGVFYPWGFTSDNLGNNIVVPPSHMMLRTIALNDQVSYPWFAPAGTRRGGITNATAVGYVDSEGEFQSVALNNGQRDTLAGIQVNPITFITGTGLVNYGQYTRARNASSLDRINVARLVIYLRRQFAQLAKPYVFEPNDKITRDEIKGAAENLLLELVGQRAIYDYIVVCDTSNNTPARIDRNELYLDVAIEPVKAVEFIYIPLRLKNTGEIKGLQ